MGTSSVEERAIVQTPACPRKSQTITEQSRSNPWLSVARPRRLWRLVSLTLATLVVPAHERLISVGREIAADRRESAPGGASVGPRELMPAQQASSRCLSAAYPPKDDEHTRIVIALGNDFADGEAGADGYQRGAYPYRDLGTLVASALRNELEQLKGEMPASGDEVSRVDSVPWRCPVSDDDGANRVAEATGADLVLWWTRIGSERRMMVQPRAGSTRAQTLQQSNERALAVENVPLISWGRVDDALARELAHLTLGVHFLRQKRAWIAARFFSRFENESRMREEAGLRTWFGRTIATRMSEAYLSLGLPQFAEWAIAANEAALSSSPQAHVIASILVNIGVGYSERGEYQQATQHFEEALKAFELLPDKAEYREARARCVNNIGSALSHQGRPAEALERYRDAKTLLDGGNSPELMASILNNIGVGEAALERFDEAIDAYTASVAALKGISPDHAGLAGVLNNLGLAHARQNGWGEARALYEDALERDQRRLGNHPAVARDWANIADLEDAQGLSEPARLHYQQAMRILREMDGGPSGAASESEDIERLRLRVGERLGPRQCIATVQDPTHEEDPP